MRAILAIFALFLTGCAVPSLGTPPPISFLPAEYVKPAAPIDADLRSVQVSIAGEEDRLGPIELVDPIGATFMWDQGTDYRAALVSELEKTLMMIASSGGIFNDFSAHKANLEVTVLRFEHFLTKPHEMVAKYRLVDRNTGTELLERTINSQGDSTLDDGFQGNYRWRIARNRMVQDNVRKFLASL